MVRGGQIPSLVTLFSFRFSSVLVISCAYAAFLNSDE